jgi:aspartyl aminopeptidase
MMLAGPEAATRFIKFVNASPTPFHAVHNATLRLEKAGFLKVGSSVHCNISDLFYTIIYHRSEKKMTGKKT